MPEMTAHDWFRPRLIALLAEAERAGYARDVAEAVITDLVNGALAAAVPAPDENWAHDLGEPVEDSSEMPRHPSLAPDAADAGDVLGTAKIPLRPIY